MPFRVLSHVHTHHSHDSLLSSEKILAAARRAQVDVLIVTDHETIAGSREIQRLAQGNPKFVPTAGEFKTEKGDIIGIFLRDEIRPGTSEEVILQIRSQGGLVLLPHPYKSKHIDDRLLSQVDLIESVNSRCSDWENERAGFLAEKLCRPILGGADAHCAGELGAVFANVFVDTPSNELELRHALLTAPRQIERKPVSGVYRPYSQMIKAVKTRNPILFLSQSKRLAATFLRESLHHST
jgi:predicted metal-dependent phosphoesterase TrpH